MRKNDYLIDTNIAIGYMISSLPVEVIEMLDDNIAATAISNQLVLITRNTMDFKGISKLQILKPYDI